MSAWTLSDAFSDAPHLLRRCRAAAGAPWPLWLWCAAALGSALGGGALAWSWLPDAPDTLTLQTQIQDAQSRLQSLDQRWKALRAESTQPTPWDGTPVSSTWPSTRQSEAVVWALFEHAQQQSLQMDSFQPEPLQTVQGRASRSVQVRLQGRWAQVLAWSQAVFQQAALWVPERWHLKAGQEGQVLLEAVLRLHLRPDPDTAGLTPEQAEAETSTQFSVKSFPALPAGSVSGPVRDPFQVPTALQTQLKADDLEVHPLFRWPLEQLKLVGVFSHQHQWHGVVLTPAGLFAVTQGDRLGAEGGRVLAVQATALEVRLPAASKASALMPRHQFLTLAPTKP